MADRLTELLAQNAGLGDEEAALQLQMLRAKTLRDRAAVDPRRTTAKGGMFSALARGVNAYRGGTMEAEADTTRAGLDARRQEIMRNLPAIGGPGGAEVAFAADPAGAARAAQDRADRNEQIGTALARTGSPTLVKAGEAYSKDSTEQTSNVLKSALARMGDMTKHDLSKLHTGAYTPETGGYMLDQHSGKYILLPADPAALEAKLKRAQAAAGATSSTFPIEGPDGTPIIVEKPKATGSPARPVKVEGLKDSAGAPLPTSEAQPPTKALTSAEQASLKEENRLLSNLSLLSDSFKPEFAGKGVLGNSPVALAQALGDSGLPGANVPLATWWATFRKMVENVERKKQLGSAITPMENHIYSLAQIIRPGMPAETIKAEFARVIAQAREELVGQGAALKAGNKAGRAVDATAPNQAADPGDVDALLKLYGEGN